MFYRKLITTNWLHSFLVVVSVVLLCLVFVAVVLLLKLSLLLCLVLFCFASLFAFNQTRVETKLLS